MQNTFFVKNVFAHNHSFFFYIFQVGHVSGDLIFVIETIEDTDYTRRNDDLYMVGILHDLFEGLSLLRMM